jgi:hypothetical protein
MSQKFVAKLKPRSLGLLLVICRTAEEAKAEAESFHPSLIRLNEPRF